MTRFVTLFDTSCRHYITHRGEYDAEQNDFWDKSSEMVQDLLGIDDTLEVKELPEDLQMRLNGWPTLPGLSDVELLALVELFWRNRPETVSRQLHLTCCNIEVVETADKNKDKIC